MKDSKFIIEMIGGVDEAVALARHEFGALDGDQINWKPSPTQWSIGQCLDHLIVSDVTYLPVLQAVADGKHRMSVWERISPLSVLFGRMLVHAIQEKPTRKMRSPKIFRPEERRVDAGVVDRFTKHLDSIRRCFSSYQSIDIDRTHISSPVSGVVTFSLRNLVKLIVQHQFRHINQAIAVKNERRFGT